MKKFLFLMIACIGCMTANTFANCNVNLTSHTDGAVFSGTTSLTWTYSEDVPGDCLGRDLYVDITFGITTYYLLDVGSVINGSGTTNFSWVSDNTNGTLRIYASGGGTVDTTLNVSVDNTAPTLSSVTLDSPSAQRNVGDTFALSFTSNEALQNTPDVDVYDSESNAISCGAVTDTSAGARTSWSTSCTVAEGNENGFITFTIDAQDDAGNDMTQVTSTTDSSTIEIAKYGRGGGGPGSEEEQSNTETVIEETEEEKTNTGTEIENIDTVVEKAKEEAQEEEKTTEEMVEKITVTIELVMEMITQLSSETFDGFVEYLSGRNIIHPAKDCEEARCEETITNKEVAAIAVLMGGHEVVQPEDYTYMFSDVNYKDTNDWVPSIVETGLKHHLLNINDDLFHPDAQTTRAETYTMLMKAACIPMRQDVDLYSTVNANGFTIREREDFEGNRSVLRQEVFTIATRILLHADIHGGCNK